jgi:tetratricopeptide (TPR) repeat protein
MAFNKEKVMDAARKLVDKGQIEKAIKEYLRVVREDPQDVRVWLKIGDLHAKKGQKAEATDTYLKVARFYQDQGFFTKAVAVYKQILKLDPRLVEVHLKLAELYRQLGLMSDAMMHFESVATHFHREGKTKEALATIRQLVELDPQNVATRIKLAELYSKEGMVEDAVHEFSVVCDQMRRQARQDDFIKVAERLLWHRPDHRELNRELAGLYLQRSDPRRALQKLQVCFKADPRDVDTLALLAAAFQALDQKGKTVSVLKELARILDETRQRARAEEVFRKILIIAPGDADATAYLAAGRQVVSSSQPQLAAAAPPVAAARPPEPRARLNLSDGMPPLRPPDARMTGAMPLLDAQALEEFELPDDEPIASTTHEDASPPPVAATAHGRDFAADLDLDDQVSARASATPAAEEHADEIAKILTETDVYVKYGLHQKAVEHLRRVFAIDPDNLDARERLKDVYLSQGREVDAITELLRLVELTARVEPSQAEQYLREVLALDGANRAALELVRRYDLDISLAPEVEVIEGSPEIVIESDEPAGLTPVDDDVGDLGEYDRGRRVHDFEHVDPTMFDPASGGGTSPSVRMAAGYQTPVPAPTAAAAAPVTATDTTRQVGMAEVERLLARTRASSEPGDVARGSPLPFRAAAIADRADRARSAAPAAAPAIGSAGHIDAEAMRDAIDASLEDSGDDIDLGVARELRDQAGTDVGLAPDLPVDLAIGGDDDDLPFDPAAAREFDAGMSVGVASSQAPTIDGESVYPAAAYAEHGYGAAEAGAGSDLYAEPAYLAAAGYVAAPFDAQTQMSAMPPGHEAYEPTYGAGAGAAAGAFPEERTAWVGGNELAEQHLAAAATDDDRDVFDPALPSFTAVAAARSLEDELEDADEYASHGHLAEAMAILRALQARFPRHPLVAARVRDLQSQLGGYGPSTGGTQTVDPEDLVEVDPEDLDADDDVAAALARERAGHDAVGHARPSVVLAQSIEETDADTHFDLGLAYKEMGLHEEAIKAFHKVVTSPAREVQSRMMIGLCYRERGDLSEAVHHFKAGLHSVQITERERQTLLYEIGSTYHAIGDINEAIYYFEMVVKRDAGFLDAAHRLDQLRALRR